jgi:GT2 family glycosyltransferase
MIPDKLALIIATKDRPIEIRRLLESLSAQSRRPDQVVVVDGGANRVEAAVLDFPELNPAYLTTPKPSAARQRNMGLTAVAADVAFVGFLDDDAVLEPGALESMMEFWEAASVKIGGAALNMTNHPPLDWSFLKTSRLAELLGLYSSCKGAVMPSGFQTQIGTVGSVTPTDWLPATAVWRRRIFERFRFDDWFDGYSYLEDLDYSYRVGKEFRLVVLPGSRYSHLPAASGRGNGFVFGLREVRNRLHFVGKNPELSIPRCVWALLIRTFMNLALAIRRRNGYHFRRFVGNLAGLAQATLSTAAERRRRGHEGQLEGDPIEPVRGDL